MTTDQEYRTAMNARAATLATVAELRGEAAGIIAGQAHDPRTIKLVEEVARRSGEPVEEVMARILDKVRKNLLPDAKPITPGTTEPNAAVAAYRAKLDGTDT